MEAMASGLPVITIAVGAITEQIDDGATGFMIPPNDVDALSAATLRLVSNHEQRRAMVPTAVWRTRIQRPNELSAAARRARAA